jgi:hypothetical protein
MLKKLLIGLFLLGMLCGAGSISAGPTSVRVFVPTGGDAPASITTKSILCGGGNC